MGRRGPKPLSDAALRARGSDWHRRRRPAAPGPSLPAEAPAPPEDLPPGARRVWDDTVPVLAAAGAISKADRRVLELYCRAVNDCAELAAVVARDGHTEASPRGGTQRTGASRVLEAREKFMLQLARELRLTPGSRGAFRQPQEEKPDPLVEAGRKQRGEDTGSEQVARFDARRGPTWKQEQQEPSTPRLPSARDGPGAMDRMDMPDLSRGPSRERPWSGHNATGGSSGPGEPGGE